MIGFIAIAAVMVAIALAWLLPPLLRTRASADIDRAGTNLGILHDQLAELEREHAAGHIGAAQYAETRADLERRVLDEVRADESQTTVTRRGPRLVPWLIAWCVPIVAGLLYYRFGDPQAFNPMLGKAGVETGHAQSPEQFDQMLKALESRLQREPGNVDGWLMLARSYYQVGRFPDAARAFEKLVELVPDEADILADYADALAMVHGRQIDGKSLELINRALRLNPTQWKALAMAGTAAFNRKDYAGAIDYWERLQASLPPDVPIAQQIGRSIAEARSLAGMPAASAPLAAAPAATPGKPAAKQPAPAQPAAAAGGSVSGMVNLSEAVKAKASPNDSVFIFARAAEGSRMPLALAKVKVSDLPAKFSLDDSMAMSPDMKLSTFPEVVVGARVSKSGQAMPASGDLEGLSRPVKIGARDVSVTIDRILP